MTADFERPADDLRSALKQLIDSSESALAILSTKEGTVLAEAGDTTQLNTSSVAALVAAMYSATREVARMVGEKQFSVLLQQGETHHIHMSLVGESEMLVIVFADYRRIGRVRHEARKCAEALQVILRDSATRREQSAAISTEEFKQRALNLVDRIFEK